MNETYFNIFSIISTCVSSVLDHDTQRSQPLTKNHQFWARVLTFLCMTSFY